MRGGEGGGREQHGEWLEQEKEKTRQAVEEMVKRLNAWDTREPGDMNLLEEAEGLLLAAQRLGVDTGELEKAISKIKKSEGWKIEAKEMQSPDSKKEKEDGGTADERPNETPRTEVPEISRERFKELNSLNVKVDADLAQALDALNKEFGLQMQHRESGFHVTVLGPVEKKLLDELDDAKLAELQAINKDIRNGIGVEVQGIGIIDGATAAVAEKDKQKKTSFLAVDAPALNAFRQKLGLPPKDFHITLGFEGGDIHFELTGEKDAKGKDVARPIRKKADPKYDALLSSLPKISFGGLSGEAKEQKQEKPVDAVKEAKQRLKKAMADAGLGGKDLIALGFKPGPEMGKVSAAIEAAISGGELVIDAPEDLKAEIRSRIENARGSNS